ncbi:MAG: hypothetical protein LIR50_00465 [Bacillota bacterium]|nr:hypothetical protein [Bacillota bacterium]
MADNIIQFPEQENNEENVLTKSFDTLGELLPNFDGTEDIAAILALPDNEFKIVSPIILSELERAINNLNDKLLLVQGLNAAGLKAEDIIGAADEINKAIDAELSSIPQMKRDFVKQVISMVCNAVADTEGLSKRIIQIPLEKCHEDAQIPVYAHLSDSGLDLFAVEDMTIKPGETVLVKTGLKVALPTGYELQVRPKSGRALKTKMRVANTPGTIDAGYRDEICVIIDNIEAPIKDIETEEVINVETGKIDHLKIKSIEYGSSMFIGKGEKFAQLVLMEVPKAAFYEVEHVEEIGENRGGGFGSTGVK